MGKKLKCPITSLSENKRLMFIIFPNALTCKSQADPKSRWLTVKCLVMNGCMCICRSGRKSKTEHMLFKMY